MKILTCAEMGYICTYRKPIMMMIGSPADRFFQQIKIRTYFIDFDLTVSITDNAETGAKVGVMASVIGLGASSKEGTQNASISKIRFNIPVMLPSKCPFEENLLK